MCRVGMQFLAPRARERQHQARALGTSRSRVDNLPSSTNSPSILASRPRMVRIGDGNSWLCSRVYEKSTWSRLSLAVNRSQAVATSRKIAIAGSTRIHIRAPHESSNLKLETGLVSDEA